MRRLSFTLLLAFFLFGGTLLFAQTHVSVPLDHAVYYLLDMAEARGLCSPLPAVKPYTRGKIVEVINEILAAEPKRFGGLSDGERTILADIRAEFLPKASGLDFWKGMYRFDTSGKRGTRFSLDLGLSIESINSGAYYMEEEDGYIGTDTWGTLFFKGDVGANFSYDIDLSAGIMRAQRSELGEYDTHATELIDNPERGDVNRRVYTVSQPKAFFPYTYQKHWDGFIFGPGNVTASSMEAWPEKVAIGPSLKSELSGTAWDDMLLLRFGRIQREWGAMLPGSSLSYNASARPFIGLEMVFNPIPWFALSSLTGILEYYNSESIVDSAWTFQNAFSIGQIDLNYKNYFHLDFGSSAVWPKRFELGYIFPLMDNYLYQNFIGDFDNVALFFNFKGRYPGMGGFWFSFFLDEAEVSSITQAFKSDRHMFAYQAGLQGMIPGISFASISVNYTKIEPYTYSHTRFYAPWYSGDNPGTPGGDPLEISYTNNGVSLGYYLPPNSDEIKVRFDARPWLRTSGHWQYQLIRHGADYGPHQVDGSSMISELDPVGRSNKDSLRKNFLQDGAYQWMHIIKFGVEHKFSSLPVTLFGEAGLVYSYFTDISDAEYAKYTPTPEGSTARTPAAGEYLTSTAYILTLGFRIFK